jgi:acetylornithine deacetylase
MVTHGTTSATGTALRAWIDAHRDQMAGFLAEYIRQRSVNPGRATEADETSGEEAAQRWLAAQGDLLGLGTPDIWSVAPGRPHLVWRLGTGPEVGVAFNGHVDTVGVSGPQRAAWDGDPYDGQIRDGRVIGRGAADMKAGTVAFLWAARAVREVGVPLTRAAVFSVTSAEETTESEIGILSLLDRGYRAPVVICAEPTDLRVCPAGLGIMYFRVVIEGKSAHSASRAGSVAALRAYQDGGPVGELIGVDPIGYLADIVAALRDLDEEWRTRPGHPLLGPGVARSIVPIRVSGGASRAEIADRCEVEFAVTLDPLDRSGDALTEIRTAVDRVASGSRWLREHPPTIEFPIVHRVIEPLALDPADALIQRIRRPLPGQGGSERELGCMPGPCDANILTTAGQPAIVFGPGRLEDGAHGTNEFVRIDDLLAASWAFACVIAELC